MKCLRIWRRAVSKVPKFIDISGRRFGKLTVIERSGSRGGKPLWKCQCDCGNVVFVVGYSLKNGSTKSCGCLRRENRPIPRKTDRLYIIWKGMKSRCSPTSIVGSKWYSDKGISVCEEWENDFPAFKKWALENGYDYSKSRKEQQIDRIDNSKGYSPDNCRLVTSAVNNRNKDNNLYLTYNGETLTAVEWSERLGVSSARIEKRMRKSNDPHYILFAESRSNMSNTGIKGIFYLKSINRYVLQIKGEYMGCFNTLEGAIQRKEEYENGK